MAVLKALRPAAASVIERLELDFVDLDNSLSKLESREHWSPFYETVHRAPGTETIHPAPVRLQ
jgi:hypothetical protein